MTNPEQAVLLELVGQLIGGDTWDCLSVVARPVGALGRCYDVEVDGRGVGTVARSEVESIARLRAAMLHERSDPDEAKVLAAVRDGYGDHAPDPGETGAI